MDGENIKALARISEVRSRPKPTLPRGWRTVGQGEITTIALVVLAVFVGAMVGSRSVHLAIELLKQFLPQLMGR